MKYILNIYINIIVKCYGIVIMDYGACHLLLVIYVKYVICVFLLIFTHYLSPGHRDVNFIVDFHACPN